MTPASPPAPGPVAGGLPTTAVVWRPSVLELTAAHVAGNPFTDVSVMATFTAPSGRVIRREAYWDGGTSYKVSFAPTEPGQWTWTLAAPPATGLDGRTGALSATPYDGDLPLYRHGFPRVAGRFLAYDDATPFFWLGDTHWEFAYRERWEESNHPDMDSMFRGMLERRAAQGYTVYQTNLRSDALMGGEELFWDTSSTDGDRPNIGFYQDELDRRMHAIADAGMVNAMGLAWFMSIDPDGAVEHYTNLARYLMARYGALPLVWTLAGEAEGYEPGEAAARRAGRWGRVAQWISEHDSYGHLATAHAINTRPFTSAFHDEPWHDLTLNQAGHGDLLITAADYRSFLDGHGDKPFIESEAMYELCSTLEEMGTRLCTADMLRRVAYMSVQLGGAGYTYGAQGIWDCVWDKESVNPMMRVFNRFDVTWAEAIDAEGGAQMGHMRRFYQAHGFEQMEPLDPRRGGVGADPFGGIAPLLTATADRRRLIGYYQDRSGTGVELRGLPDGTYRLTWFDPRTGTESRAGTVQVRGGAWTSPTKPGEGDWLLVAEHDEADGTAAAGTEEDT